MTCMLAEEIRAEGINLLDKDKYIAERKLNGTRCLYLKGHLINRRNICYDNQFPELLEALKHTDADLDGEIVYFDPETGVEDFGVCISRCSTQSGMRKDILRSKYPIQYTIFDVLRVHDTDLRMKTLTERKEILTSLAGELNASANVKVIESFPEPAKLWEEAKTKQWEGIILKHKDSPYIPHRTSSWLKLKNLKTEVLRFDSYEVNNAGITLVDNSTSTRVQYGGKLSQEIRETIDENGSIEQEIHYLYKTDEGKYFQPVIKAETKQIEVLK